MAVLHAGNTAGHLQTQLTRSLEKILEDAHHSGELKLSNRKLKDLPVNRKYDLSDTVIADLSKNRLSELPEDVTSFYFLEKLQCYHNAIRSVPEAIGGLQCLSYLDLSRNQLTTLPRELCHLPIQILLVSNNRLAALPDDLHRMSSLTELDASCNQLTHLPSRLAELTQLQSLVLRGNLLLCVPLDITVLPLTRLDLRANRIGVLPVEMRDMTELVELYVEDNPLTAPPASLCRRGRVHIFKYLETEAIRLGYKVSVISSGTLSRRGRKGAVLHNTTATTVMAPPANLPERLRKRQNVDSGYSTSDDKRWSQEMSGDIDRHWTSSPISNRLIEGRSANSTPSTISPGPEFNYEEDCKTAKTDICDRREDNRQNKDIKRANSAAADAVQANSVNGLNLDDKSKPLQQIQTYREYKEALRQQRAQDGPAVYRTRGGGDPDDPPTANTAPTTPTHHHYSVGAEHGGYRHYLNAGHSANNGGSNSMVRTSLATSRSDPTPLNSLLNSPRHVHHVIFDDTSGNVSPSGSGGRKPIQKVTPLRNVIGVNATVGSSFDLKNGSKYPLTDDPTPPLTNSLSPADNNRATHPLKQPLTNPEMNRNGTSPRLLHDYIKPSSPIMNANNVMGHDNIPSGGGGSSTSNGRTPTKFSNGVKIGKTISWSGGAADGDIGTAGGSGGGNGVVVGGGGGGVKDKMTFTMRREIDKAKEETDLINQLRNAIESRLKMQLPYDLAPSLTDGVVLCHLANVIKPRSVASIHVPSPAVPKLTMARCRRNVDNFIEACRKIGVDEAQLCRCVDVTEALCARAPGGRGLPRLLTTVLALCDCQHKQHAQTGSVHDHIYSENQFERNEHSLQLIPDNVRYVGKQTVITTKDVVLSYVLLSVFVFTVLFVIMFPPPN